MTVTYGDWINGWRDWLPLVEVMIDSEKHAHERPQLEQRKTELYEELKCQVAKLLEELRDSS
jgi:hypothetical protein